MTAFNSQKYFDLQTKSIHDRIQKFSNGRLYLEIGGKFLYDGHAQRVLPGFDPLAKIKILKGLNKKFDLIFCVNSEDILTNRLLSPISGNYVEDVKKLLLDYENALKIRPIISLNKLSRGNLDERIQDFINLMQKLGYRIYLRYEIENYPNDIETIISEKGYGFDQYIEVSSSLVIVSGAASNSGKLSTCLGQIYHENLKGLDSGYAKYELFPIWNLSLHHPVNLAYEAATADIGDYNVDDHYHFEAYREKAVNYNRDEDAFKLLKTIAERFVSENNFIRNYKSPTDMGINMAGFCIEDEDTCKSAAIEEIQRRRDQFKKLFDEGKIDDRAYLHCDKILSN